MRDRPGRDVLQISVGRRCAALAARLGGRIRDDVAGCGTPFGTVVAAG